ncbi:hypothetical protein NEOKW01_0669 [Nematocida sp. AWRm80]|nr:hypothetical protein NEOKW01_0669 [Nematocida sp. AWRm80]
MMDEKKRYSWVKLYREGNNLVSYDQMHIKEPFNEFFEGVFQIDKGKDIQRYYRISLHLIVFLVVQRQIKESIGMKKKVSDNDLKILELKAGEIFHCIMKNIPKLFLFESVPPISLTEESVYNIKSIIREIAKRHKHTNDSHRILCEYNVLLRALRGDEILSAQSLKNDKVTPKEIPALFKVFSRMKDNPVAESFYKRYEMVYFLNIYLSERSKYNIDFISQEDTEFIYQSAENNREILPKETTDKYEIKVTDRRFVILVYSVANKFAVRMNLSSEVEKYLYGIIRTFLLKEKYVGYFQEYLTESLLTIFCYLAVKAFKIQMSITMVYEVLREIGFISSFYIKDTPSLVLTISDLLNITVIRTYNTLIYQIEKNSQIPKKLYVIEGKEVTSKIPSTPIKPGPKGSQYILSPLSGRMSQILPITTGTKKILFKDVPENRSK